MQIQVPIKKHDDFVGTHFSVRYLRNLIELKTVIRTTNEKALIELNR